MDAAGLHPAVIGTHVRGIPLPPVTGHAAAAAPNAGDLSAPGRSSPPLTCDDVQEIAVSAALPAGAPGRA